jgi:hypothetical protein
MVFLSLYSDGLAIILSIPFLYGFCAFLLVASTFTSHGVWKQTQTYKNKVHELWELSRCGFLLGYTVPLHGGTEAYITPISNAMLWISRVS